MADKKFSQFTSGGTNQSPTDELVGLDISLPTSQQNTRWTLNDLFSKITRNITDKVLRFQAGSSPLVSSNNESAIYSDGSKLLASSNGGAYAEIPTVPVTVPQGGTGQTSLTPYAVVAGGATGTGAIQQVSGLGSAGQVLTSNGAGALPSFQSVAGGGGISGAVVGNLIKANSTTTGTDAGIVSTECANSVSSRYNVLNYASLAAAVSAIGSSAQATLVIPTSTSVAASLTVTGNITLEFTNSGMLNIASGQTITIQGPIIAPLRQIFTGAGTATFTNNRRISTFYPQWWGGLPDSSTDSTAAGNAAIAAAISINSDGGGGVFFSPGTWRGNFTITTAKGIRIWGESRNTTIIKGIGSSPALAANGLWYSRFEGLSFFTENALSGKGVVEIDGNYDGIHTQGVQGNTFYNCYFSGQGLNSGGLSDYAFTMCRQGTNSAQGSENLFLNCHFQAAQLACYYQVGYNALNNTFIGGNFQWYSTNGILLIAGSVQIYSIGFQSTLGYTQIINDGWDINFSAGGVEDKITIYGCRTESLRFVKGGGAQYGDIRCFTQNLAVQPWAADTAFSLNTIVEGTTSEGSKLFRVTTAGSTGAVEPTWPTSGTVADGSIVWTQTSFYTVDMANGSWDTRTCTSQIGDVSANYNTYMITREITADTNLTNADWGILANSDSGTITINTATAGSARPANDGQIVTIRRATTSPNPVIVTPVEYQTITLPGGTLDAVTIAFMGGGATTALWRVISYYSSQSGGAFNTLAGNPTTSNIASGQWALYKNTSSGVLSVWANDGGVMKSVALT